MRYDKAKTLKISTIGRRTGKIHTKTIQFAVNETGRLYIATKDTRRDWVKNAKKNPSVDVRIGNTTRSMLAVPLTSDSEKNYVRSLYRKKCLMIRALEFFGRARPKRYGAFELRLH